MYAIFYRTGAKFTYTCSKHIHGKSLRIQETDAVKATAVSVATSIGYMSRHREGRLISFH